MSRLRIGIDLGGTKIEGVALDGERQVGRVRVDTPRDDYKATLEAVADHGVVRKDIMRGSYDHAREVLEELAQLGISYDEVVAVLETEGVEKLTASWSELGAELDKILSRRRG